MKSIFAALATSLLFTVPSAFAADPACDALLRQALAAQGGEQKLREIHTMEFNASGYRNLLEQSERPEGPYATSFNEVTLVFDYAGHRYLRRSEEVTYPFEKISQSTVVNGDVAMLASGPYKGPGTSLQVRLAHEAEALSPARLLLTALEASNTHCEADAVLQAVPQKVVTFDLDDAPVRIYLNAYTHLPTAVDYSGPVARGGYWHFLGDVTQRTYYSLWWLAKGGIHLPMQWNVESNGLPDRMMVISKLKINDPLPESDLIIPAEVRSKFDPAARAATPEEYPLGSQGQPSKEIAPGVLFIPGSWNVTLVRQEDGIVVLEAPISSGYSAKVIAEVHRRFPGQPIKAVVTTSDSWPHLAGIREYVAAGVPVYALDLNRPILDRVLAMPYTVRPDLQQRSPRKPQFHLVESKTVLGTGENRLELYPIRGETSERQMMVYFPELHLLYGSDPFQKLPDGSYFYPQTVTELMDAVKREHLDVRQFFMMHMGPTPWADLIPAVQAAAAQDTPTGVF